MELQKIECDFSVCKISDIESINFARDFIFLSRTPEEISLVCETAHIPHNVLVYEPGWRALKVSGMLDFGMVGVIAKISNLLATAGISIFVVSTYNTDYVLVKAENLDLSVKVLADSRYVIK